MEMREGLKKGWWERELTNYESVCDQVLVSSYCLSVT